MCCCCSCCCSEALEAIIRVGAQRVLTSGGCCTAEQGRQVIRQLVQQAAGRITIMAGGGVRASNAVALVAATGVTELHSAASRCVWERVQGVGLGGGGEKGVCCARYTPECAW